MKINEVKKEFEIVDFNEAEGFTITRKNKNEKVIIYDKTIIENLIEKNFEKKYKKILYQIMMFNEDESSDDSDSLILQIDEFKRYLITKYFKYIGSYKLNQYMNMIMMLEGEININKRKGR